MQLVVVGSTEWFPYCFIHYCHFIFNELWMRLDTHLSWRSFLMERERKQVWLPAHSCLFRTIWKASNGIAFRDQILSIQSWKAYFVFLLWSETKLSLVDMPTNLVSFIDRVGCRWGWDFLYRMVFLCAVLLAVFFDPFLLYSLSCNPGDFLVHFILYEKTNYEWEDSKMLLRFRKQEEQMGFIAPFLLIITFKLWFMLHQNFLISIVDRS